VRRPREPAGVPPLSLVTAELAAQARGAPIEYPALCSKRTNASAERVSRATIPHPRMRNPSHGRERALRWRSRWPSRTRAHDGARHGHDRLVKLIAKRVGCCLRGQRNMGRVTSEDGPGQTVVWWLRDSMIVSLCPQPAPQSETL
jgi:hypothetical protein